MSRAELADAVNQHLWLTTGEHYGLDAHTIARYERGKPRWPSAAYRAGLKSVLEVDTDAGLGFYPTRRGSTRAIASPGGLAGLMTGAEGDALTWVGTELHRLELDYDIAPSAALLAEVGQLHGSVKEAVHRTGAGSPQTWVGLQARSALLMGQLVWDASRRRDGPAALAFFDEAIHCAQRCRDHRIAAQAQLRKCFIPLYTTHSTREALISAQRATHMAEQVPTAKALALLHVSEAHAQLGHRQEAEQFLNVADQTAEQAGLEEVEWSGRSLRIAGSVFLALQSPRQAQARLEQARPLLSRRHKSQALVVANLALAHVRQGSPDYAAAELDHSMRLVEPTQAGGALTVIAGVLRELAPWRGHPVVAEAGERFLDLIAR